MEAGLYEDFEIAIDEAQTFTTSQGSRPGRLVVLALRQSGSAFVSFMHLISIEDHYVKTRLTIPAAVWQESGEPVFAEELFSALEVLKNLK